MPIKVECKCGNKFGAPSKYAGKKVKCPKCSTPLVVAAAKSSSSGGGKGTSAGPIKVKCKCGKAFAAKPELAGKTVRCPGCKEPIKVARQSAAGKALAKSKSNALAKRATPPQDDPFADIGLAGSGDNRSPGRKCPECQNPMKEEDILCIQCGFNERLGRKMEVDRPVTQADREKAHMDKVLTGDKAGKESKPKRGWFGRKK